MGDKEKNHITETLSFGTALALVGGFLDAYTFIARDGVFANAQTGNVVMLGVKLFGGEFYSALRFLVPILAFAIGVFVVQIISKRFKDERRFHWRQIILFAEFSLLSIVATIPSDFNTLANILVSFVCAMQAAAFRTIDGITCATTMCTGNLRSGTEFLFKYFDTKDSCFKKKAISYYRIDLVFLLGAGIGAIFTNAFDKMAVVICAIVLASVCCFTQLKLKHCF